jgi:hypothetical protein
MAKPKKRMGRPTKPPREGERVSLGLRVTAGVKRALEKAAIKTGRSISQEAEIRLELSLRLEQIPAIVVGQHWAPILFAKDKEEIAVLLGSGDDVDVGGFLVALKGESEGDVKLIRNYLSGAPFPWGMKRRGEQ